MIQLSRPKSIIYHLYPGFFITVGFVFFAPIAKGLGFPPQMGMMAAIVVVAVPILLFSLVRVKMEENKKNILQVNGLRERLSTSRLILYSIGLVVLAFIIWGITQPLNVVVNERFFGWLPDWFTLQDFSGFDKDKIRITLVVNLLLNGVLAPYIEELYFRGYLLPRMKVWGGSAFLVNAVFFSLYHFWQPGIYITLILALLPMTYAVWKTQDLRLAILTHCLLNVVGALLSFGMVAGS